MALLVAFVAFLAVLLVVVGVHGERGAKRWLVARRLAALGADEGMAREAPPPLLRRAWGRHRSPGGREPSPTARELRQAGLALRVSEYLSLRLGLAFILFVLVLVVARNPLVAFPLALVGYMLPRWYVASRRQRRLNRINNQLGDLLTLLSNSLKSGYGLMQGMEFAANQLLPPLASELKRFIRDVNLGTPAETALAALSERVGSADIDLLATAITIHRSVGGNLAEILDNVATTLRERDRLRGEVRTLTAQQQMTGIIIGFLPLGIGLLFFAINPDYMGILFTTTAGRALLAVAAGLEAIGALLIRKMIAIEV